jgi:hypothetical protein
MRTGQRALSSGMLLGRGGKGDTLGATKRAVGVWLAMWFIAATLACKREPEASGAETAVRSSASLSLEDGTERLERAPISLTTTDGAGLQLVGYEARTVIEDPLVFTELHLTFRNPESRRREGRFQIVLPQAAAISRFAMRVGGELQEGEVVARLRAQRVYEDFLHRRQDPALLEHSSGNAFSARVFPIEASADKEIVLAYSEELAQRDEPYRLRIAGMPEISHLKVDVKLGANSATGLQSNTSRSDSGTRLSFERKDFEPRADLLVRLPMQQPFALRSGELVVARVRPVPTDAPEHMDGLTVLFDTSASRALGFAAQIERLGGLLMELVRLRGRSFDVRIVAFDQQSEELYHGPAEGFSLREKGKLLAREALGATDLHQALEFVAQRPSGHGRLLLSSDGVVTAGDDDGMRLREAVAKLAAHGIGRLDVLAEGSLQDGDALHELTHAGLKSAGVVLRSGDALAQNAARLLRATRDTVAVHVSGARWVYPAQFEGVQAGDERLVFAEVPVDQPVQIELDAAGATALRTLEAAEPLLQRAYARAKIASLTRALKAASQLSPEARAAAEAEIIALSRHNRVLSEYTALLVLESAADYERFGIAQKALSSILQVGADGLELIDREKPTTEPAKGDAPLEVATEDDAIRHDLTPIGRARGGALSAQAVPDAEERTSAARAESPRAAQAQAAIANDSARAPAPAPMARDSQDVLAAESRLPFAPGSGGAGAGIGGLGAAAPALEAQVQLSIQSAEGLAQSAAARSLRGNFLGRARACYALAAFHPGAPERVAIAFSVSARGVVERVAVEGERLVDGSAQACLLAAARSVQFAKPEAGAGYVRAALVFHMRVPTLLPQVPAVARAPGKRTPARIVEPRIADAYTGALAEVLEALRLGDVTGAARAAHAARERDPLDVLGLIAWGEVLEAQKEPAHAARAYGSLIDLFPARADLRRMAGERLERLGEDGLDLAVDTYGKAVEQRPDHPSGHRLLAFALLKRGAHAEAFRAITDGQDASYPRERFPGVGRILDEDLALVAAAWRRAVPERAAQIEAALAARGLSFETGPSLRFVLNWETDANDVDFHIYDGRGGHASYLQKRLPSGGELYADVTTGYGPECFTIRAGAHAYPYVLQAHYYARGPMGYGMGKLQVIDSDGKGGLSFGEHPFVVMKDKAFVGLARREAP